MRNLLFILAALPLLFAAISCDTSAPTAKKDLPAPKTDAPATQASGSATAVLAGGCFWCMEAVFEPLNGVTNVVSGYAGGTKDTATYAQVGSGDTNHAESVQITYDPSKITYGQLLHVFFALHDPTTKDRQGPDWGRQYRSTIFYQDPEQKRIAQKYIQQLNADKVFAAPIVTTLEPLDQFYPAEEYHQDYVQHHPENPYVQQWAIPKIHKVQAKFKDLLKPASK